MHGDDGVERPILVTAFGGCVFGLDHATGQIRWKVRLAKRSSHGWNPVEIMLHGNRVLACPSRGDELVCIAYPGGEEIGRAKLSFREGGVRAGRVTMLVEGDSVFVGRTGQVQCFDLDGRPRWHQTFEGEETCSVALGFPGNVRQADYSES